MSEIAQEELDDTVYLVNQILPELATFLAYQRRDFSIDVERFPPQYPVEDQAKSVDDTPVHNLDSERLMGLTDTSLKKYGVLAAT